ncbi:hypothetical protein B0T14DRAFT_242202 [Immersiella caudata]|uniref:Uncharacterized protein n=1 Tax=Immersiella caudata TaxID=314043 RepID=A0AA40BWF3_9PEZI|nr:hypothetical protein B0T14DRAFT_242202 [Immersiella caudata]
MKQLATLHLAPWGWAQYPFFVRTLPGRLLYGLWELEVDANVMPSLWEPPRQAVERYTAESEETPLSSLTRHFTRCMLTILVESLQSLLSSAAARPQAMSHSQLATPKTQGSQAPNGPDHLLEKRQKLKR